MSAQQPTTANEDEKGITEATSTTEHMMNETNKSKLPRLRGRDILICCAIPIFILIIVLIAVAINVAQELENECWSNTADTNYTYSQINILNATYSEGNAIRCIYFAYGAYCNQSAIGINFFHSSIFYTDHNKI